VAPHTYAAVACL